MTKVDNKNIFTSVVISLFVHSIVIAGLVGGFSFFNTTSDKSGKGLGVGRDKALPQYIQVSSIEVDSVSSNIENNNDDKGVVIKKVVKTDKVVRNKTDQKKTHTADNVPPKSLGTSGTIDKGGQDSDGETTKLSLYVSEVKKLIGEKSFYPKSAKRRGIEGTVNVSFSVSSDGTLYDVDISKASGFNLLDDNALSIVKSVSPLPIPPREDLRLELPLVFSIKTIW